MLPKLQQQQQSQSENRASRVGNTIQISQQPSAFPVVPRSLLSTSHNTTVNAAATSSILTTAHMRMNTGGSHTPPFSPVLHPATISFTNTPQSTSQPGKPPEKYKSSAESLSSSTASSPHVKKSPPFASSQPSSPSVLKTNAKNKRTDADMRAGLVKKSLPLEPIELNATSSTSSMANQTPHSPPNLSSHNQIANASSQPMDVSIAEFGGSEGTDIISPESSNVNFLSSSSPASKLRSFVGSDLPSVRSNLLSTSATSSNIAGSSRFLSSRKLQHASNIDKQRNRSRTASNNIEDSESQSPSPVSLTSSSSSRRNSDLRRALPLAPIERRVSSTSNDTNDVDGQKPLAESLKLPTEPSQTLTVTENQLYRTVIGLSPLSRVLASASTGPNSPLSPSSPLEHFLSQAVSISSKVSPLSESTIPASTNVDTQPQPASSSQNQDTQQQPSSNISSTHNPKQRPRTQLLSNLIHQSSQDESSGDVPGSPMTPTAPRRPKLTSNSSFRRKQAMSNNNAANSESPNSSSVSDEQSLPQDRSKVVCSISSNADSIALSASSPKKESAKKNQPQEPASSQATSGAPTDSPRARVGLLRGNLMCSRLHAKSTPLLATENPKESKSVDISENTLVSCEVNTSIPRDQHATEKRLNGITETHDSNQASAPSDSKATENDQTAIHNDDHTSDSIIESPPSPDKGLPRRVKAVRKIVTPSLARLAQSRLDSGSSSNLIMSIQQKIESDNVESPLSPTGNKGASESSGPRSVQFAETAAQKNKEAALSGNSNLKGRTQNKSGIPGIPVHDIAARLRGAVGSSMGDILRKSKSPGMLGASALSKPDLTRLVFRDDTGDTSRSHKLASNTDSNSGHLKNQFRTKTGSGEELQKHRTRSQGSLSPKGSLDRMVIKSDRDFYGSKASFKSSKASFDAPGSPGFTRSLDARAEALQALAAHARVIKQNSQSKSLSKTPEPKEKLDSEKLKERANALWTFALKHVRDHVHKSAVIRGVFEVTNIDTLTLLAQLNKQATDALDQLRGKAPQQSTMTAIERVQIVSDILAVPWQSRTDVQNKTLFNVFGQLPGFAKFSSNLRQELLKLVTLDKITPGRIVIKAGHLCLTFYIILEGICMVKPEFRIDSTGAPVVQSPYQIGTGASFGDFSLISSSERRTVTVTAITTCYLLRFEREMFKTVVYKHSEKERIDHISFLRDVRAFEDSPDDVLERIAGVMQPMTAAPDAVLMEPGQTGFIYFVKNGKANATREIPFLKELSSAAANSNIETTNQTTPVIIHDNSSNYLPHYFCQPYNPTTHKLVKLELNVGTFRPGEFFPRLLITPADALDLRVFGIAPTKIDILLRALESRGCTDDLRQRIERSTARSGSATESSRLHSEFADLERFCGASDLRVVAQQRCECFRIAKLDLVSAVDDQTLTRLCQPYYEGLLGVTLDDIQQAYLTQRVWKGFKSGIVDRLHKNN